MENKIENFGKENLDDAPLKLDFNEVNMAPLHIPNYYEKNYNIFVQHIERKEE